MTLRTVTYDDSTHKIVPLEPTIEMKLAFEVGMSMFLGNDESLKLAIAVAPECQEPDIRAKLAVNMIKYLGATKTQAKAIIDGVFDGENTVKELLLLQDLPNTLAGFLGGCAGSGVTPTQQMIYDAGVKSGMNRIQSQAQQESKPVMPVGFLDHGGIFYSYREKIKDGTELYVKPPEPEGGE